MLTGVSVERDREKSTVLDERLFELAVKMNGRSRPGFSPAGSRTI